MIISVESPVVRSGRAMQVAGMFDVDDADKASRSWDVKLPLDEKPWNVGLIVGPSGSGKSTIARHVWPQVTIGHEWDAQRSILDAFPAAMSITDITRLLSSVGLGSAPSWLRPYQTLSTGEQFRANMALSLASDDDPVVVDEFTSVVDRQVGQVASYAVAKTARRQDKKFVAVTCHYDVEQWLDPEWVLRTDTLDFAWRCKRGRPEVQLDIGRVSKQAWKLFSNFHYLKGGLPGGNIGCWGAWIGEQIVGFAYVCIFPHPKVKDIVRTRRLVVLPDWQGLGVGSAMERWLAAYYAAKGYRYRSITVHPGLIRYYTRSPEWAYVAHHPPRLQVGKQSKMGSHHLEPRQMSLRTFEWRGTRRAG